MACLTSSTLLQISHFVLMLFLIFCTDCSSADPTEKATKDIIEEICSQTVSPPFCSKILTSNPQITNDTDINGLANISIELAKASANETKEMIGLLMKQETNLDLKKIYGFCTANYDEALVGLGDAERLLGSGDYNGMHDEVLSAMDEAEDCEDEFDASPNDNPQLQVKFDNFKQICSIIYVVIDRLK